MKARYRFFGASVFAIAAFLAAGSVHAQMMGSYDAGWTYPSPSVTASSSDDQMIARGKALWQELGAKQISCNQLTQDNYEQLGEYFMDQMTGIGHESMDSAMSQMMGEQGDQAMHIAMGQRLSGCVPNAGFQNGAWGQVMQGGWSAPWNGNNWFMPMMGYYGNYGPMMGYGYGDPLGLIFTVLIGLFTAFAVIMLIKWLAHGSKHAWREHGQSALDILKERYAKGEIERKEFEEKKKDLEA